MDKSNIKADKIKQPIQLLAAWLVAMIAIISAFFTAAATIQSPTWLPAVLAIAAILYVPMFTWFIYRMQTKFRVQMQDDSYFSEQMKFTLEQNSGSLKKILNDAGLGDDGLIEGKSISDLQPEIRGVILAKMAQKRTVQHWPHTLTPSCNRQMIWTRTEWLVFCLIGQQC